MKTRLAAYLRTYIRATLPRLLAWDLRAARWVGAPKGHTLSGHAWKVEQDGKLWGRFWRPRIDAMFLYVFNQVDHCKKAHAQDLVRAAEHSGSPPPPLPSST